MTLCATRVARDDCPGPGGRHVREHSPRKGKLAGVGRRNGFPPSDGERNRIDRTELRVRRRERRAVLRVAGVRVHWWTSERGAVRGFGLRQLWQRLGSVREPSRRGRRIQWGRSGPQ